MTKETEEYRPLKGLDLNNARNENESYKDYRKRLKQNSEILKLYSIVGLDAFKEMYPAGVGEAIKNAKIKSIEDKTESKDLQVEAYNENAKELGKAK